MKMSDFDAEKKADELLAALGQELGESRASYMEALMDDQQEDPPFFDENPVGLPKSIVLRKRRRVVRRAVILAAVLILMMGLVVVSSEGVRLKLSRLFFNDAPGSTKIMDDTNLVVDVSMVEVGYVPEGFEVVSDEIVGDVNRDIICSDGIEQIIISILKTELYALNIDNERMEQKEILINDKQGYLFIDEQSYMSIWQLGDCTISITATVNEEEIIKLAENIFIK